MHHHLIVTSNHLSPCALDCLLVSPPEPVLARLAKVLSRSFPPGEGDLKNIFNFYILLLMDPKNTHQVSE